MSTPLNRYLVGSLIMCLLGVARGAEERVLAAVLIEVTRSDSEGLPVTQSFVADVSDANVLAQLRRLSAQEWQNHLMVFEIAPGEGGVWTKNRNFHTASQAIWNWHVARLVEVRDITNVRLPASEPRYGSAPSTIAADPVQWIAGNGTYYSPIGARVGMEFGRDGRAGRVVNVSNRGVCGQGDRVLIAGFVVQGAEPRRVLIRGKGPSLAAFGISNVVLDPSIRLYAEADELAANDNWKEGQSLDPFAELSADLLAGLSDEEAALVVTLAPGAYTVHMVAKERGEGIGLIEVFDVNGL